MIEAGRLVVVEGLTAGERCDIWGMTWMAGAGFA